MRPPFNTGMTVLDRSKFTVTLQLLMAEINPRLIGPLNKESTELLNIRGVTKVVALPDPKLKGVLFDPKFKSEDDLSSKTLALLGEAKFKHHSLDLNYDHWTLEQVLHSILPQDLNEVPTGFTIVGHIAHFNLRDRFLPYKNIIGQVVLDKNSSVRTVVNKLDSINTVFRTFDMEIMAGDENDFWVEHHESNCRFQFDFRKVYWNSRLHSEHERLVSQFVAGQAVCDPFAGVGPFSVPAGKKNVLVFANDLNPDSVEAMRGNVSLNKVQHSVKCYNEDAREFIRASQRRLLEFQKITPIIDLPRRSKKEPLKTLTVPKSFSHYVMNLPATAIEFLDAFRGLHDIPGGDDLELPCIHVHCFHKHDAGEREPPLEAVRDDLAERISKSLGHEVPASKMDFHDVRKVAPTKEMYCVSFELPREVARMKKQRTQN